MLDPLAREWYAERVGRLYEAGFRPFRAMSEHESDAGTLAGRLHADKPDVQILREALDYDPETGELHWKVRPEHHFPRECDMRMWNKRFSGRAAGGVGPLGYCVLKVQNVTIPSHCVIWALVTGEWPDKFIDHINGVRDDNRISNLRLATPAENSRNARLNRNNTSGVKGVYWFKASRKWQVRLHFDGRLHHFGYYEDKEEAIRVIQAARLRHHDAFANHG